MEDSEPTFNTEPSSSAMRARPLTWVLTRSCQSTTDLVEAVMVFEPRAMLTAGMTRATSPARVLADCGAAKMSVGMAMHRERSSVRTKNCEDRDFVGMKGRSFGKVLSTVVTQSARSVKLKRAEGCAVATGSVAAGDGGGHVVVLANGLGE